MGEHGSEWSRDSRSAKLKFVIAVFLLMLAVKLARLNERLLESSAVDTIAKDPDAAIAEVKSLAKGVTEVEDHWWQPHVEKASREYTPSNNTDWCEEVDANSTWHYGNRKNYHLKPLMNHWNRIQPKTGIHLVKIHKTASTTAASITMQIAASVAAEKGFTNPCPVHPFHGNTFLKRVRPNFLWTVVRDPYRRSKSSYFFFDVTRKEKPYNSKELIKWLDKEKGYQINYMTGGGGGNAPTNKTLIEMQKVHTSKIYNIIRMYDFIAVTERMDESLAVMKLLFGFPDEAFATFSSTSSGGFDFRGYNQKCRTITKSFTTEDVEKHIAPGGKYQRENLDYFLYAVANQSLDKTIRFLGRERVESEVIRLKQVKNSALDSCLSKAIFPCTTKGRTPNKDSMNSCYFSDVACGHECIYDSIRNHT